MSTTVSDLDPHGTPEGVLSPDAPLTEENLTRALAHVPCASMLVCGVTSRFAGAKILYGRDKQGKGGPLLHVLKIVVDPSRDPNGWEIF
jgi:hypothetical protein